MKQTELDLEAGIKARDEGMKAVAENSGTWFERARLEAHRSLPPFTMTGEAVRDYLREIEHVGSPHHPNGWGALIKALVRDGLLKPTGHTVPSRRTSSHAHATPEYEVMQ